MARIAATSDEKIFQLKAFAGLHQNPDGDTKLKFGEAAKMRNFAVTRDGNLRKRPGTKTIFSLGESPIAGMWTGFVSGREVLLAACGGKLWSLWNSETEEFEQQEAGSISTEGKVHFFGFGGIVYILDGAEYRQWDGENLQNVHGYRPLVQVSTPPEGGGETLENVNRLCGERRIWISPDGEAAAFALPEKGLESIDWVKSVPGGELVEGYTADLETGIVTFANVPEKGVNSYEIAYSIANPFRSQVTDMRFSELYNDTQDSRIFLYGDGSNKAIYSGVDADGLPRADYFPDLFEMAIGDANTPITALIRHYSTMMCFKSHSAYLIRYGEITLSDGLVTAAFYSAPTNRSIGNSAMGQAQLVLNSPRTLFGEDCYEWRNNGSYASNLSMDERQAKRVSDKVYATLGEFDTAECVCFDNNETQEYYICNGGRALVHNYAVDAWYEYSDFDAVCFVSFRGEMYIGRTDGQIRHVSYEWRSDEGEAIKAYWESGSMSFNADYMRKYAATLWVGVKPEANTELYVTVQTDRRASYTEKFVYAYLASLDKANFAKWSFGTNRRPQMKRIKIKAKKFVFYKLIFSTETADTTATLLAADIKVRYTGQAK